MNLEPARDNLEQSKNKLIQITTTCNTRHKYLQQLVIHMASSLLDIQPIAAEARPVNATAIHSTTFITKNGQNVHCRGGIVAEITDL